MNNLFTNCGGVFKIKEAFLIFFYLQLGELFHRVNSI